MRPAPGARRSGLSACLADKQLRLLPRHAHARPHQQGREDREARPGASLAGSGQFEYRFDRSDTDTSLGAPNHNWTGKVANASGTGSGLANHTNKTVPSVMWLQQNYPLDSYYVPAHTERAGVFNPNGNNGFNVEHFRDFNNAGPTVAVGFNAMSSRTSELWALFWKMAADAAKPIAVSMSHTLARSK